MRKSLFAVPLAACLLAACGSTDLPSGEGDSSRVGEVASPIINGQADTTHQAVVTIVLQNSAGTQQGLCTGTIIKVDPTSRIGWVLTAAHCTDPKLPPTMVLQGDNFNKSPIAYQVVDYERSSYTIDGNADQPYDVAVVRIAGVDANTPTISIPSSSNDGLSKNVNVVALGYGRTSGGTAPSGDPDGVRRKVTVSVADLNTVQIAYGMNPGGTCQGDSGGPDLVTIGGVETVVGIHSYGDQGCQSESVSGRVTGNLSFINAQLTKALPTPSCDLCQKASTSGNGKCAQVNAACLADADCMALNQCLNSAGTQTAQQACTSKYPNAMGKLLAASECRCMDPCTDVCASEANCKGTPKCGFSLPAGSCSTCSEGSCCQEMFDCTADGVCFNCLQTGDKDPSCASNAARKKLGSCASTHCSSECSGSNVPTDPTPGTDGADGGDSTPDGNGTNGGNGASPGTTTTTTTSGCSLSGAPSKKPAESAIFALAMGLAATVVRRRSRKS